MLRKTFYFPLVLCGNILEHRDKALFTLLAPFIGPLFFPESDLITALLNSYFILFLGLLARPLGGFFFGFIADRYGRAKILSITIIGMSLATIGIGFVPTYAKAGFMAPAFLALCRFLQNFFAAGETQASSVFLIEHSTAKYKALTASFFETSTVLGILLASVELYFLNSLGYLEEGWRILFWLGGILGILGWVFRTKLPEPEEFNFSKSPLFGKEDLRSFFFIFLLSGFSRATYVIPITFMNGYLLLISDVTIADLTKINSWLLLIDLLLLPIFGALSTKLGERKMMSYAAFSVALSALPLFQLLPMASLNYIYFVRLTLVVLGVIFSSCYKSFAQSLIPPEKRCTILSLGNSFSQLFVEGFLTVAALWVFKITGFAATPAFILMLFSFGALYVLFKSEAIKQSFGQITPI